MQLVVDVFVNLAPLCVADGETPIWQARFLGKSLHDLAHTRCKGLVDHPCVELEKTWIDTAPIRCKVDPVAVTQVFEER